MPKDKKGSEIKTGEEQAKITTKENEDILSNLDNMEIRLKADSIPNLHGKDSAVSKNSRKGVGRHVPG